MTEADPSPPLAPLYQDKFVDIYQDHLNIKCFYFPFGWERRIAIGPGAGVSFTTDRELGFRWRDRKAWGMALNNVWWARDWVRDPVLNLGGPPRHLGVVLKVGAEPFRKGFSVEDEAAALRALESVLPRTGQTERTEMTEQPQPPSSNAQSSTMCK